MKTIELYAPERVQALERQKVRALLVLGAVLLAGVLLCGIGLWLRFLWLCVLACVGMSCAAYYLADEPLRAALFEAAFAHKMQRGAVREFTCTWQAVTPEAVFVEGVRSHEIVAEAQQRTHRFYIRWGDEVPNIEPGTPVQLETVQRYIRTVRVPEE